MLSTISQPAMLWGEAPLKAPSEEKGEGDNYKINSLDINKEYKCISRGQAQFLWEKCSLFIYFPLHSEEMQRMLMISVVHRAAYQIMMSHYDKSVLVFHISNKNVLNIP